ncbi:MAG: hypothetical protein ACOY5F_10965 [Pseudomonadota bacterium]
MPKPLSLKALKSDLAFVEKQLSAHPDPFDTVRLMWDQRRKAIKGEIESLEAKPENHARVALLFSGNPVIGSQEIKLDFASKVLDSYQNIIASLASERAGLDLGARGKLPRTFASKLFIRDIVRGSVGFLVEEAEPSQLELVASPLKEAVDEASKVLGDLSAAESKKFDERIQELSPRTISAIKKLAKVLHDAGAETKIVDDDSELSLDDRGTASLYTRLNDVEYAERREELVGFLQGLLPEKRQYEFQVHEGRMLYGPVSEEFDLRWLGDPHFARSVLFKRVQATFLVASVVRGGVTRREDRILENVHVVDQGPAQLDLMK